jgi:hypothetical protein
MNNRISPYLSLGIGYSFDATDDFKEAGFLLNPTAGVSFKIARKFAIHAGIGYEMQNLEFYSNYANSHAIDFVFGISI